jgi:hypothetical protein
MDKDTFNARLQEIAIKDHPRFRPFHGHGSPLNADVFLIGLNPATSKLPHWWTYWDTETGFDFNHFEDGYLKHRDKKSRTRIRMELIIQELHPHLKWVETNVYAIATRNKKTLTAADKESELNLLDTSSLDLLLEACRPRAIFVHGKDACQYLGQKVGGLDLRSVAFTDSVEIRLNGYTTLCYPLKNQLGRPGITGVNDDSMLSLGQKIRAALSAQGLKHASSQQLG